METGMPVNRANHDRLWDESGREWTTRWIRWTTVKDVKTFLGRSTPVGHIDDRDEVLWMSPDEAKVFWSWAKDFFEVPGMTPGSSVPSWGAHIWRHEKERRLVFTMFT